MNRSLLLLLLMFIAIAGHSSPVADSGKIDRVLSMAWLDSVASCEAVVKVGGYPVRIVKKDGELRHFGLNLFTEDMKGSVDTELLESVESALAAMAIGMAMNEFMPDISFVKGDITDFKTITPATHCAFTNTDSRSLSVEWNNEGRVTVIGIPVSYQSVKGKSRAEIEGQFIQEVTRSKGARRAATKLRLSDAEPYGNELYVIPGATYQGKNITQNVYLVSAGELSPVWDKARPLESIANMFICPDERYGGQNTDITVLKHEIGDKQKISVSVNQLLSYCEKTGCRPFWGIEKFENGILEGALFLFNPSQGYDHVFKVTCMPEDVIEGKGRIEMRASLFVPTNNVGNLFVPYRKKSEKEKIRYDK